MSSVLLEHPWGHPLSAVTSSALAARRARGITGGRPPVVDAEKLACADRLIDTAAAIGVGNITPVNSPWVDVAIDATDGPGRGQTIADLRGQRLGPVDQPGAHTRMVLDTDRKLPDHLVERLTSRPGTTMQPGSRVVAAQGTVVVVGSINADLSLEVSRHTMPGETVPGRDASMGPGGKGANQAVAAAVLGGAVTMVGAAGEDLSLIHISEPTRPY